MKLYIRKNILQKHPERFQSHGADTICDRQTDGQTDKYISPRRSGGWGGGWGVGTQLFSLVTLGAQFFIILGVCVGGGGGGGGVHSFTFFSFIKLGQTAVPIIFSVTMSDIVLV